MTRIASPTTDPTQEVRGNADGTEGEFFGNEHDTYTHRNPQQVKVGQADGGTAAEPMSTRHGDEPNIPEDAGRRASVDQRTGAVRGSGSGAGGGVRGEGMGDDIDRD